MTVQELIERLEECDPDAEVLLVTQENWPFENSIAGVTAREECVGTDSDEDDEEYGDGCDPGDVFIVEGQQLRYGTKNAWNACY